MDLKKHPAHILALLAIFAAGCSTTARLDALMNDLHRRGLFSGAVVVGEGSRIVYAKGFGDANVERAIPFTPDTPADGASLAKTFTAALVLMQHLDLDAPARTYLPELPYAEVTLRHLLTHRSGIPVLDYDWFDPFLPPPRIRTTEALLNVIAEQKPPLLFAPGSAFEYSSFGYDLALLAASRAAGKPAAQLLDERIFRPLGITSAFLRPARLAGFPGTRTLAYDGAKLHDVFDYEGFHGGSNIYISARDLHRWNTSAFPAAALEPAGSALTLGNWYYDRSRTAFWYSGHLSGFHSEVFRDTKSRTSIVYMSNNTIEPWLQKGLVRAIAATLRGRDVVPLMPPAVDVVPKEQRAALLGRWLLPGGESLAIEQTGTRLGIVRDNVSYRLVQISPRMFYAPGLDYVIGFGGALSRIHVESNIGEEWGVRQ